MQSVITWTVDDTSSVDIDGNTVAENSRATIEGMLPEVVAHAATLGFEPMLSSSMVSVETTSILVQVHLVESVQEDTDEAGQISFCFTFATNTLSMCLTPRDAGVRSR
jgi:hypothetical protein